MRRVLWGKFDLALSLIYNCCSECERMDGCSSRPREKITTITGGLCFMGKYNLFRKIDISKIFMSTNVLEIDPNFRAFLVISEMVSSFQLLLNQNK